MFADDDKVSSYIDDYAGEYANTLVKETYDLNPDIIYPCVDINELTNVSLERFKDDTGEYATGLSYQFNISCEQNDRFTAKQNVRRIAEIIDNYFQDDKYRCFDRVGGLAIAPNLEDPNIMTGYIRYKCALVSSQNLIYRRY